MERNKNAVRGIVEGLNFVVSTTDTFEMFNQISWIQQDVQQATSNDSLSASR